MMCKHAKKVKCFQTNIASKIKLLIRRKIGSLVPLIVFHNLSKNAPINKLNKMKLKLKKLLYFIRKTEIKELLYFTRKT